MFVAAAQDPDQAHKSLETGQRRYEQAFYDLAMTSFAKAADALPVETAIGTARCLIELGRASQAIERLERASETAAANATWQTVRANALAKIGRYADALAAFRMALKLSDAEIEARVRCAQLLTYLGRRGEALALLTPLQSIELENYDDAPAWRVAMAAGRLLLMELQPPKDVDDQTEFVLLRILQPAFDGKHRARWMARLAAADLFAAKHNGAEARGDYEAVIKLRPRVADAYVGLARLAYYENDNSAARTHVLSALEHNPNHAAARRLLAQIRLDQSDPQAALALLNKLLEVNPNDLEALALASVASKKIGRAQAARKFIARAQAVNPRSGLVQFTLAIASAAARQFGHAEQHLVKATEYAPNRSAYQVELANLWLLRGEEARAVEALKKARGVDPYNARIVELLNMLYDLEAMERVETEHFVLRYESDEDRLIALVVPQVLEDCYSDITSIFKGYAPLRKTLVEIFPRKSQFAVRVSGRPWISTVGASTGPVIAMVSPRKDAEGLFGWANVLRHEFVHTVTLALCESRMPRWMAEGLAEHYGGPALDWSRSVLIAEKLRQGALYPVKDIDKAFFEREDPNARSQGYAQGRLMVEFVMSEWGDDKIDELLNAYRRDEDQRRSFESTLGVQYAEFDRRFAAWCAKQVESWGLMTQPYPTRAELKKRIEADGKDAAALGLMARLEHFARDFKSARRYADRALTVDDRQPDALMVRAQLPIENEQPVAENVRLQQLEDLYFDVAPLLELRPKDPQALWPLAKLARDTHQRELAADIALKLTRLAPGCTPAHRLLTELYMEVGDNESAYPFLVQWARRSPNDTTPAIHLADLFESRKRPDRALPWAEEVIRIDMFEIEHYKRLGRLLVAAELWSDALMPLKLFCELSPEDDAVWADLADAYARLGRKREAAQAAEHAISLNADSRAQQILLQLYRDEP